MGPIVAIANVLVRITYPELTAAPRDSEEKSITLVGPESR